MIAVLNTLGPRLGKKKHPLGVCMAPSETELGAFIREKRFEAGLSQVELAEETGIWQTQISMIERGERKYLEPWQITALAYTLQCDTEDIRRLMPIKYVAEPTTRLGRLIKDRREQLKMTIEDLAKAMNMPVNRVKAIELRHDEHLSYPILEPLAQALRLDPTSLTEFLFSPGHPKPIKYSRRPIFKLSKIIWEHRRRKIMSQPELAARLGVKRQVISQIEGGQYSFYRNDKLLRHIAEILDIDFAKLQAIRQEIMRDPNNRPGKKTKPRTPLGRFVLERRLSLDLTRKQVDQKIGLCNGVTAGIELGLRRITPELIRKLSRALKCKIPTDLIPTNLSKSKRYRN